MVSSSKWNSFIHEYIQQLHRRHQQHINRNHQYIIHIHRYTVSHLPVCSSHSFFNLQAISVHISCLTSLFLKSLLLWSYISGYFFTSSINILSESMSFLRWFQTKRSTITRTCTPFDEQQVASTGRWDEWRQAEKALEIPEGGTASTPTSRWFAVFVCMQSTKRHGANEIYRVCQKS